MKFIKVCLDSRFIKKGDYFVPVVGENSDGHKYIDAAMENGAAGVIEENELYEMADKKLGKISPTVIAVTGSVGKTTMRDFIFTLLLQKYKVCKGTLNTKLGLATNIMNDMQNDDEFFIAECGMDRAGELKATGEFIKPHAAVMTNISESHMEKLGSLEAIKNAKAELFETVREKGVVFLNWDDANVRDVLKRLRNDLYVVKYGLTGTGFPTGFEKILFKFIGKHNILNALGAAAISDYFKVDSSLIKSGLLELETPQGRLKIIEGVNGSTIIDDTYNSSPVSAVYALEAVADYYRSHKMTGRKIAVLGGMLELGDYEDEGHLKVGKEVSKNGFDVLVLVGELAQKIKSDVHVRQLAGLKPQKGDIILVKASQGIRLEKVVQQLMAHPEMAGELLVRQDARWK